MCVSEMLSQSSLDAQILKLAQHKTNKSEKKNNLPSVNLSSVSIYEDSKAVLLKCRTMPFVIWYVNTISL